MLRSRFRVKSEEILFSLNVSAYPANIGLFKVNNRNTRKKCEICSMLTIESPEQRH